MANISEKDRGTRDRGLPATIKFIRPPRAGPQGVIKHGQKVWELEQDFLIEGKAPKNTALKNPRFGKQPEPERPLPAVQARPNPPAVLAPNRQDVTATGNRYGAASQPMQVEPLVAFVAETPTELSWLARVVTAEGVTGGTTVGGSVATTGLGASVAVVAGVAVVAIGAVGLAVYTTHRAYREYQSSERARATSKNLHESVMRAVYQQWQNGIITDEEYVNYLATGVLVIQERPLEDSANRDIRGTKSTGVQGTGAVGAGTLGGARPLVKHQTTDYSRFNIKGRVGDPFEGHEILMNSWLKKQRLITTRGKGLSRFNSAIALTAEEHDAVSALQRARHLYDEEVLKKMTARQVILANAQILLDVGVPMERVIEIIDDSFELLIGIEGKTPSGTFSPTGKIDDAKKKKK